MLLPTTSAQCFYLMLLSNVPTHYFYQLLLTICQKVGLATQHSLQKNLVRKNEFCELSLCQVLYVTRRDCVSGQNEYSPRVAEAERQIAGSKESNLTPTSELAQYAAVNDPPNTKAGGIKLYTSLVCGYLPL